MLKYTRINLLVLLIIFLPLLGTASKITFFYASANEKKATLIFEDQVINATFNPSGIGTFILNNNHANYATIKFGISGKIRIYIESGNNLDITYLDQQKRVDNMRCIFKGDKEKENFILNNTGFYNDYKYTGVKNYTPEQLISQLNDLYNQNEIMLNGLGLSPTFISMENNRMKYHMLLIYIRYCNSKPEFFPYLKQQMIADDNLFFIDEYMKFMEDGLEKIGSEGFLTYVPYNHTNNQFKFLMALKTSRIKEYLMTYALSHYIANAGIDEAKYFLDLYNTNVKYVAYHKEIQELCVKWEPIKRGSKSPDFSFPDRNGVLFTLDSFKGKFIYIDCWASWCSPCLQQIPYLKKIEERFEGKNIVFVGLSKDANMGMWKDAIDKNHLAGIQLSEKGGISDFSKKYNIEGIPRFILIDKEGKILNANMMRPSDERTIKYLDQILN
jgi:thiol-disulfide isomerase/thioredoxin